MNILTRAQELGKKAAELRQAVKGLPAHAAQIREAVTMTGGELKQLRAEVQSNMHALRADSEDRLLGCMREINDHSSVFEEAGYALDRMELDLALTQRLAVHLEKFEDVPHASIRSMLSRQNPETIRSILTGIIKAEETAGNVEISRLEYRGLVVHIGAVPTIRMTWRDANLQTENGHATPANPVSSSSVSIAAAAPQASGESSKSMFELRDLPSATKRGESTAPVPPVREEEPIVSAAAVELPPIVSNAWSSDALARFKKMPGTSKYR
jgi:hypothetical protein